MSAPPPPKKNKIKSLLICKQKIQLNNIARNLQMIQKQVRERPLILPNRYLTFWCEQLVYKPPQLWHCSQVCSHTGIPISCLQRPVRERNEHIVIKRVQKQKHATATQTSQQLLTRFGLFIFKVTVNSSLTVILVRMPAFCGLKCVVFTTLCPRRACSHAVSL